MSISIAKKSTPIKSGQRGGQEKKLISKEIRKEGVGEGNKF